MSANAISEPNTHAELLMVGGRSYAFGLRWTSATSRSTLESEAIAAAITEAANFVVLHRAYNQFGLASIANAATGWRSLFKRPRSGVATIAQAAGGAATLAAFPLADDRWLVLAIDKKGILPEGDMIVAGAAAAKARIQTLIAEAPTGWRKKFLPEEWGVAGSKSVDPTRLLSRSGAAVLLPLWLLTNRRTIRTGLTAAAILMIAMAIAAIRVATTAPPPIVIPFQRPEPLAAVWTPAALSLDRCLSALRDAQRFTAVPGWIPVKYACANGEYLTIAFERFARGQISVMRSLLPRAQLSDDGRSAVLAIPLLALPRVSAAEGFAPREQYRLLGLDLAQRLNGSFILQTGTKALPGEADPVPANQSWTALGWTYQTRAPAIVWESAIARLGAISVESVALNPTDSSWQIAGSLYAKR